MKILEDTYNELAIEDCYLTERKFSREYLGRCETYYAYLKCAGKQASAGALINLWRRLASDKAVCEMRLGKRDSEYTENMLTDWLGLYDRLERKVRAVILKI
jgi:hypothetical protein